MKTISQKSLFTETKEGIAGILHWQPPADLSWQVERNIISSTQGRGTGTNADGSVNVVVTGEIYNLNELKSRLGRDGSDAEIIACLYEKYQDVFLDYLRGIFQLALWDQREQRLLLVADKRTGLKTFYYYAGDEKLVFGSNAKLILAQCPQAGKVDEGALTDLFTLGQVVAPDTMFAGIKQLTAGSLLECRRGNIQLRKYYQPEIVPAGEKAGRLREEYFALLYAALARSFVGIRQMDLLLSGGIDSSVLLSLGRRYCDTINTYTIGFSDQPDYCFAQKMARRYQSNHYQQEFSADELLAGLPAAVRQLEVPGTAFIATFVLAEFVAHYTKLVWIGDGNDAVWGFYNYRSLYQFGNLPLVDVFLQKRALHSSEAVQRILPGKYNEENLRGKITACRVACNEEFNELLLLNSAIFGAQFAQRETGKFFSEAHGLTLRAPYLDQDLAAFIQRLPLSLKVRRGITGKLKTKCLFRQVVKQKQLVPPDIIRRKKDWLTLPLAQWLRGEFGTLVAAKLNSKSIPLADLINVDFILYLLQEHCAGRQDHTNMIMLAFTLALWLEQFPV